MELPTALRQALDRALDGVALADLQRAAAALSVRYRGDDVAGREHLANDIAARAYLATRMPATYAAIRAALDAVALARPDFAPASLIDVGAGPGTALWAASDCWPDLARAILVERGAAIRGWGERLAEDAPFARPEWRMQDVGSGLTGVGEADLVTLAYALGEINAGDRPALIDRLWAATGDVLVVVEPGTPAGWERILAARARLIASGAHVLAPCPHGGACPLTAPDWCHFSARLSRSRQHRLAKGGAVPWEDEKFIYLAASRHPGAPVAARVIARPRAGKGKAMLKLCLADSTAEERMFSKRQGDVFRAARRADWGDALDAV